MAKVLIGCETSGIVREAAPSADRWKIRSKCFPGLAEAMANQWGAYA